MINNIIDNNSWMYLSSCSFGLGRWEGQGPDGKTLGVIQKRGNMEWNNKVEREKKEKGGKGH